MPLEVEDGGGAQYSFALEYDGPPVPYDLPRAVPINVSKIPVAAVVSPLALPGKLPLPVVKPLLADDPSRALGPRELKSVAVSPTSVIGNVNGEESRSDETASTVSPTSVIERAAENSRESGELSSSGGLEFSTGRYGPSSSGAIDFSDSFGNKSREGLATVRVSEELNQDWESNESVLSVEYPSSRVSSVKAASGECHSELINGHGDGRRTPVVKFANVDSEGDDLGDGEVGDEEYCEEEQPRIVQVKREPQSKGKKGTCYRCFKGNRCTEKEVCLVCDAKYCSNCILRAMGSMPEGRKCLSCIGYPIDESNRANLGKCSRMLKKLLNDLEVRQIMKAEKFCEANQLPPEYICVNGMPLCHEELVLLQTCVNPPKKLKPGNYWYDKVSGLWGKEGQKPSQIISAHLNVGGPIDANASNGNANVYINGREITKTELRMLQLAGVQCAGNPHFWVNEDGSYQEEGQKNTKGYIWGKGAMKLVCTFLSLPVPSKSSNYSEEQMNSPMSRSIPDYLEQRTLLKFLLVGCSGSGTSTIFKQAKILYKPIPFTEDERENIKLTIQGNVYGYLGILLEGRDRFEEESSSEVKKDQLSNQTNATGKREGSSNSSKTLYTIGPRLKSFSDWLLKTMVSGNLEAIFPAATREYAPLVEELWKDPAIQATYKRRSELEMLPRVASYFLERAVEILVPDYEPSDLDILYAEGVTSSNGLASLDFSFPQSTYDQKFDHDEQHDSLLRYQLIRLQPRGINENCKWLEMFEDIGMIIFCVSLSDYDQVSFDINGSPTNKMMQSRKFFETIVTHPTFEQMDVLLILNKFDVFEEKMERVPLTECEWFDDFHPLISRHHSSSNSHSSSNINHSPSLGQLGFHYVAVKFKRLYALLTGRKLFVSMVKALEPDSVDSSLKYAREIMKWDDERPNFSLSEYSIYSTEASSYSP
ncbi:unnamed protein product [Linum tenue]|uniref:Extra-large guanine nucleotide-binding protein 1 n=1 Tax=Linum tenue TaxID=586396 RepID=A0AAV0RD07_9ROSI|nr:unnamed protein product [Linum tenue]